MINIGVIDSGVGGLTVLFDVIKEIPNCNYFYIGDSKNCPYGEKDKTEIMNLSYNLVNYLVKEKNIDILIIACNSISSTSIEFLQSKFINLKIIGTTKPTVDYIKNYLNSKKIGIIATKATIDSNAYQNGLKEYETYAKACPNFVKIVESGKITEEKEKIVFEDLKDILNHNIDTLILGCTHYPLLIPTIRKVYKNTIVTSSEAIIKSLSNLIDISKKHGDLKIYTTGNEKQFEDLILSMFKRKEKVEHIDIS